MDSSCRVEELAQALHASTVISPNRYSWISPEQLCADLRTQPVVIIDVRENKERDGGHIKGSIRCGVLLSSAQMDDLASRWREGAHIVFTCIRSLSRAPLAAQRLIQHLDQMGNAPFPTGVEPRVSLLDGGIVGFVEYLFRQHGSGGTLAVSQQDDLLAAILAGFDQSMWTVGYFPEGARAAHVSELGDFGPVFSSQLSNALRCILQISPCLFLDNPASHLLQYFFSAVPHDAEARFVCKCAFFTGSHSRRRVWCA